MSTSDHRDIAMERAATTRAQGDAADPASSAWVSANAGTGKTHVLTNRVLRLLLSGTPPERILCLTFTKAAAAEMSQRIFRELAKWVTCASDDLAARLASLVGQPPAPSDMARARQLFARAIETPGGLKVQTIHAFCERLLQRFPLEAGVPPGFAILDEETAAGLRREAIDDVLAETGRAPDSELADAIRAAARYAVDDRFDELLKQVLGKPDWLLDMVRMSEPAGEADPIAGAQALYRRRLGVRPAATLAEIETEIAAVVAPHVLERARDVLLGGSKNDVTMADMLSTVLSARSEEQRVAALAPVFMTTTGGERASLMTKPTAARAPDLADALIRAQGRFVVLDRERRHLAMIEATIALMRIADAVMTAFARLKARRAALDYDDLIRHTGDLIAGSDAAEWVLFKLDGGLDHILVDEAQDTSPSQWRIVERLAHEFFAGAGAREGTPRTLFAVGDEKQSIYGFQGAAPHMFAGMGDAFEEAAATARQVWRRIRLTLSFRTVAPVLDAVDRVFADVARVPGLTAAGERVRHVASREGQAGLVEIWEPELPQTVEDADAWAPLDEAPVASPVARLADRIAQRIEGWLAHGERLASADRPITPGDILILVRRRVPFAPAMVAALKARGIPVAGADRIRLRHQIAIADLVALGNVLVLPEDDLALANVLKSPLIGLDDDDLLRFAPGRRGSLWSALLAAADGGDRRLTAAADTLKRWRRRADYMPPYELFAEMLDREGGRRRLLARLGAEAADAIDDFLDLAMRYDDDAPPSLQGFLHWLGGSEREIKRDMEHGRNEVRVMTVHGAKGLEAPIVILPDTCSARAGGPKGGLLALADDDGAGDAPACLVWPVKGTSKLGVVEHARRHAAEKEAEERSRLLYVAMTRARDRLYVGGFQTGDKRDAGCWYDQIRDGLGDGLVAGEDEDGRRVWRMQTAQAAAPDGKGTAVASAPLLEPLPEWADRPAPREPGIAVPLAPSRLVPLESDPDGEPIEPPHDPLANPPVRPAERIGGEARFQRGLLTHALLQHLPGFPAAQRRAMAKAFVEARGADLPTRTRTAIVKEVMGVIEQPAFAALFGPESHAEVAIVAEVTAPGGRETLRIAGQIDRLVRLGDAVMILDYKTGQPPAGPADVPPAYVVQLAAYRLAVAAIYPDAQVRAAILWTHGPRIDEISVAQLDAAAARLPGSPQGSP